MKNDDFFHVPHEHTIVKSEIVSKYFGAWAKIISKRSQHIGYADLFCGPGEFTECSIESTPLKIIDICLKDREYYNKIRFCFNDKSKDYINNLKQNIVDRDSNNIYKNMIHFSNLEAGLELFQIVKSNLNGCPCFYFIDPFGYKGISIENIASLNNDWGSECCFFFNYSIFPRALKNPQEKEHMITFFGKTLYEKLIEQKLKSIEKDFDKFVIDNLKDEFKKFGVSFFREFPILTSKNNKKYYLIYLTENKTGLKIMTDVMRKFSTSDYKIGFNQKEKYDNFLFSMGFSVDDLVDQLKKDFSGQTVNFGNLIKTHLSEGKYELGESDYKKALKILEEKLDITVDSSTRSRKFTYPDQALITFKPER